MQLQGKFLPVFLGFFLTIIPIRGESATYIPIAPPLSVSNHLKLVSQAPENSEAEQLVNQGLELIQQGKSDAAIAKLNQALLLWRDAENQAKEAYTLQVLGLAYYGNSDYAQAEQYYQQALALYEILQEPVSQGITLSALGDLYSRLGNKQQALETYQQAQLKLEKAGQLPLAAQMLNSMAKIYADLGNTQQAIATYEQALTIQRDLDNRLGIGSTLSDLGMLYGNLGQYQQALVSFREALPIFEQEKDYFSIINTLVMMGLVSAQVGDSQSAIANFNQALKLGENQDQAWTKPIILTSFGSAYYNLNQFDQSLAYFDQALEIYQASGNQEGVANLLNMMGLTYAAMGKYEDGWQVFKQALDIYEQTGNPSGKADMLNNIGDIQANWGNYQQSLDSYGQALTLLRQIGDRGKEAKTLTYLANTYNLLGNWELSVDYYNQALTIFEEIGERTYQVLTLDSLGWLYYYQQEYQQALTYFQQSLAVAQSQNFSPQMATTYTNLSRVYVALRDYPQATAAINQALSIYAQNQNILGEAAALTHKSWLDFEQNNPKQAIKGLKKARSMMQSINHVLGEANVLSRLGKVYEATAQTALSQETFAQELSLRQQLSDRNGEAEVHYNISRLQRQQGNLTLAKQEIEAALSIIESQRSQVTNQDLRTSFFASKQDYYQYYIDLLMELDSKQPGQGYNALALQASERARARSLLDLITEAHSDIRQGVDAQLLQQEQQLQQQLEALEKRQLELVDTQASQEQINALSQQQQVLLRQEQEIKAKIRANSPRYAALTQPQPLDVTAIQQQVLDEKTVLIEYFLGTEGSYLWFVTQNELKSYKLPPKKQIETQVRTLRDIITNPRSSTEQVTKASANLSQILLSPIAEQLDEKRLIIVSDGALQYLPFSVLSLSNTSYQPLLIKHEILNLPSASTLAVLRAETRDRKPAPLALAIFADPVFSVNDQRVATHSNTSNITKDITGVTEQIQRSAAKLGINWERLPGTRSEAESILAMLPKNAQTDESLDFAANKERVLKPQLDQYRIIHWATHGFVNTEQPELSAIVMSLVNEQGQPENGFLRLEDIYNLNLAADLVVVSACQTGLGKNIRGEGLIGLTRGFMYAGAKRVVTSLWSVNDLATAELMSQFYQQMFTEGQQPAAALRAAQLAIWQNPQWQHPYYWAAFGLQGEW